MAMRYSTTVKQASAIFCADLAPKFKEGEKLCQDLTGGLADIIDIDYNLKLPPQHTCTHSLDLCKSFPTCNLYSVWPPPPPDHVLAEDFVPKPFDKPLPEKEDAWTAFATKVKLDQKSSEVMREFFGFTAAFIGVQNEESRKFARRMATGDKSPVQGGWPKPIENVINHLPLVDDDNDRFSSFPTLRGSDWRGKDCNDKAGEGAVVYPGRVMTSLGPNVDHNCNGIYGVDTDGKGFEDKWCSSSGQMGVIAIGDSATAHFRIPPDFLDALTIDNTTYQDAIPLAENEFDWPMCSSNTAFRNESYCPPNELNITSIYLKMVERNRCNHRDFQNLGVNGASTTNSAPPNNGTVLSMKNRNGTDQPALVIYAMIGNDVCNGHPDFSRMTTPEAFEKAVLGTLSYLDARLQKGSHVVFGGLVDGRVLYDTMHALQHPVGASYEDVYGMLNCLELSPCWGWMNANATVRNMTSDHAQLLNTVYGKIIREHNFTTFDMFYVDTFSLLNKAWRDWVASGHRARDLIEPTDGFHPSQTANALLAGTLWANISAGFPQAIGRVNPFNDAIIAKFGDQGGY